MLPASVLLLGIVARPAAIRTGVTLFCCIALRIAFHQTTFYRAKGNDLRTFVST